MMSLISKTRWIGFSFQCPLTFKIFSFHSCSIQRESEREDILVILYFCTLLINFALHFHHFWRLFWYYNPLENLFLLPLRLFFSYFFWKREIAIVVFHIRNSLFVEAFVANIFFDFRISYYAKITIHRLYIMSWEWFCMNKFSYWNIS